MVALRMRVKGSLVTRTEAYDASAHGVMFIALTRRWLERRT
jgi:hypothetical protein